MRHSFEDMEFDRNLRSEKCVVHAHGIGQEQITRPGLQEGRREPLGEVSEQRRKVGVGQIVSG